MYAKREYESNNLDEEMYRGDSSYRSHVDYFIAVENDKKQQEEATESFVSENKNRFGK